MRNVRNEVSKSLEKSRAGPFVDKLELQTAIHIYTKHHFNPLPRRRGGGLSMVCTSIVLYFHISVDISKPIFVHFSLFESILYISNIYFHLIPGCIQTLKQHGLDRLGLINKTRQDK